MSPDHQMCDHTKPPNRPKRKLTRVKPSRARHISSDSPVPPIQWVSYREVSGCREWEASGTREQGSMTETKPQQPTPLGSLTKPHQIVAVWWASRFRAPNLEHLSLPLDPFEFPRPFEVFEGGCFLNKASSQMASNTLFWKGRVFEVFEGGPVFAKNIVNYRVWAT